LADVDRADGAGRRACPPARRTSLLLVPRISVVSTAAASAACPCDKTFVLINIMWRSEPIDIYSRLRCALAGRGGPRSGTGSNHEAATIVRHDRSAVIVGQRMIGMFGSHRRPHMAHPQVHALRPLWRRGVAHAHRHAHLPRLSRGLSSGRVRRPLSHPRRPVLSEASSAKIRSKWTLPPPAVPRAVRRGPARPCRRSTRLSPVPCC